MKFKKVEISAFRIFDKPEDATFDFTTKTGDTANFVSLYAPNGFGKTSFYDAVEWGITNNIQRFWQNRNTEESIDVLRDLNQGQVSLIKRTGSKGKTFVKITTDLEEFAPRFLKVHGRKKSDINDRGEIEKKGFRQVILSQEWIAAFLKEVDGELRYKRFIENPDLQEIDNYYKGVKSLDLYCNRSIQDLQLEIEKAKKNIQDISDDGLLETINFQISTIIAKYGEDLKCITLSTTQEQIKDFKDLVSGRIITYNRENILTEILDNITIAKIGDGKIDGVSVFFDYKQSSENITKELEIIKINLDKFEKLEKLTNELINNKILRKRLTEEKVQIDEVITQFANFQQIQNSITQKSESKNIIELRLSSLNTQLEEQTREEITQKNQRDTFIKQIEDIENKKSKLPELKKNIVLLKIEIQKIEHSLPKVKSEIEKKESEINALEENLNNFRKVIEGINLGQYSQSIADEYPYLANLVKDLQTNNKELYNLGIKLKESDLKIDQQQSLNSSIEEFIKSGLTIVNERQTSNCPLCEHAFESYYQLAERVSNNKALNYILQELLSEKSIISQSISALIEVIKKNNEILIDLFNKKIDELVIMIRNTVLVLSDLRKEVSGKEADLEKLNQKNLEFNILLNGLPAEEYEMQLDISLQEAGKGRDNSSILLSIITNKTSFLDEQIKTQKAQSILLENEIQQLLNKENYAFVVTWFLNNYPDNPIAESIFEERNVILIGKINNTSREISELESTIESMEKDLSTFNKEGLSIQQKEWEVKKQEIDNRIINYIHFLEDKLAIDLVQLDKESLLELLDKKVIEHKYELNKIKEMREDYQKLEKYGENLLPFLQSENAKLYLKKKDAELTFINKKVKPLIEEEREKTKNHLDKKVKDFFYEDLINALYRKIDPHPDFKSVEFKAKFDNDNPRLDVFVKNTNNKEMLIPNLYFSTAQINILSLSIFLASALNSKEYDCIFIDDPIQSMDSINVLSTIDLLRSIVVNENKQIILSTHDENFHNLLKKKMPPNLFKSKFMELESFGKVKHDI